MVNLPALAERPAKAPQAEKPQKPGLLRRSSRFSDVTAVTLVLPCDGDGASDLFFPTEMCSQIDAAHNDARIAKSDFLRPLCLFAAAPRGKEPYFAIWRDDPKRVV
jgi:hypothetical protein